MAALAIASVSVGTPGASAQATPTDCTKLPNPVYGVGGSAATPLIGRVAAHLAGANPPITIVYGDKGSACSAMTGLVPNGGAPKPIASFAKDGKYWTADAPTTAKTCTYPVDSTVTADWGSMAQLPTTCDGVAGLPSDVGDFIGTISGFSVIVPLASTQLSISAEALYYIYGLGVGTGHDVPPWIVPGTIGTRGKTSAAGLLLAKAVGIPGANNLFGTDVGTNGAAIDFVTGKFAGSPAPASNPEASLAFCSTENADAARDKVRTLAFKATGQDCAYPPDSDFTGTNATDKKNLREGRYFLWNPHHFYAKVDPTTKKVVNPNLSTFINIMTSQQELPASTATTAMNPISTFIDLQIANHNIPQCAMHVTRTTDMGPLSSFQPEKSCGCYFDFKTTGSTSCKSCSTNSDCPASAPSCNVGYCEVK